MNYLKLLKEPHEINICISIEKTIEKYKYNPQYLSLTSTKPVICICTECNKELINEYNNANRRKTTKCFKCISKNGIMKGRKHSEEAKRKIVLGRKNSYPCGKDNPFYGKKHTEETKKIISLKQTGEKSYMFGKHHSEEYKKKMSESRKGKNTGKDNYRYGKPMPNITGSWYEKLDGTKIWMRSSWEMKVAKELEYWDIKFDYEPEVFPIIYLYEGKLKEGTYTPDFYLPNSNEYIEIKGYWRGEGKPKFEAFKEQYPNEKIQLIMKDEMKQLGLI